MARSRTEAGDREEKQGGEAAGRAAGRQGGREDKSPAEGELAGHSDGVGRLCAPSPRFSIDDSATVTRSEQIQLGQDKRDGQAEALPAHVPPPQTMPSKQTRWSALQTKLADSRCSL